MIQNQLIMLKTDKEKSILSFSHETYCWVTKNCERKFLFTEAFQPINEEAMIEY